jgi:XTP/dITP diphosphohydrolase
MLKLVAATNNRNKIEEMNTLLGSSFLLKGLADIGCLEELPETQATLEGNALQKAAFVFKKYKVACFADDTGLEVEALNHAPGVYSARYAGEQRNSEDNINLLLKNLHGATNRKAQFRTVIALVESDKPEFFEGIVQGEITLEKRGNLGFGYDPVFKPAGYDKTFGEMTLEEKNKISHRAIAIKKLVDYLTKQAGS